jgi:hypothetical protein
MIESKHAIEAFESGVSVVRVKANTKALFYRGAEAWRTPQDCAELASWTESGNWGVHLGASGLVVVDVDGPKGEDSLARCSADFGGLPETLEVRTPRLGGRHLYYRCDDRGLVKKTHARGDGSAIDALAGSHYAMGPGSVFVGEEYSGAYTVTRGSFREIAPLPTPWRRLFGRKSEISEGASPCPHYSTIAVGGHVGSCGVMGGNVGNDTEGDAGACAVRGDPFSTLPLNRRGECHELVGQLVRAIRGRNPDMTEPSDAVLRGLRQWWEAGAAKRATDTEWSEVLRCFDSYWRGWRKERGSGLSALATATVELPRRFLEMFPDEDDPIRRTASLCVALQARAPNEPFFLAQRAGGEALGIAPRTVNNHLHMLQRFRFIALGVKGTRASGKASTYRWEG